MSNLALKNETLKNLKNKMAEMTWKSSFDFESFEIDEETKKFIELREEKIVNSFKRYTISKFDMCTALYEVKVKLFEKGDSFMFWYENLGFTKDKVSELLKTHELYLQAPHLKDYISSLSGLAVRMLTNRNVSPQLALELMEKGVKNTSELKEILANNLPQEDETISLPGSKKTVKAFKSIEKRIKKSTSSKELEDVRKEVSYMKKMITEMEKQILAREKEYENKNNLKLLS